MARYLDPWQRSTTESLRPKRDPRRHVTRLEALVVAVVIAAVLAFVVWFFFFSGGTHPSAGPGLN
jgi:ferric-dicitrate binding protein FerR (iron transport regulator)